MMGSVVLWQYFPPHLFLQAWLLVSWLRQFPRVRDHKRGTKYKRHLSGHSDISNSSLEAMQFSPEV